jgi:hypothetical protein
MRSHPLNRSLSENGFYKHNNLSITEQQIFESGEVERKLSEDSFPLRYQFNQINVGARYFLESTERSELDCFIALKIIRAEVWKVLDEICEEIGRVEADPFSSESSVVEGSLAIWVVWHQVSDVLDCVPDDWLEDKAIWQVEKVWTWAEIYALAALWSIDEAAYLLNAGQLYKAASWGISAQQLFDRLPLVNSLPQDSQTHGARFSKLGNDAAHAENRAARQKGLEIYRSRTWKSKADAARRISPLVHRTELVVLRWIRKFQESNSTFPEE